MSPLGTQQFTPYVGNTPDLGITYGILEGTSGGSVTGDGVYTAPLTPGTYHLTITSHADPSKTATATITVANRVTLAPDAKTVTLGDTVAFTATVPDVADQSVSWRVLETGGGSSAANGVYTAPRVAGTFHIIATSIADPARSGVATVTVQAGSATGGIQ